MTATPSFGDLESWRVSHPWEDAAMVAQDLLLSRMLVAVYQDNNLSERILLRGGTALHKLHLPQAMRYSEDIDLVVDASADWNKVLLRLKGALRVVFKHGDVVVNSKEIVEGLHSLSYQPKSSAGPGKRLSIKIDLLAQDPRSYDETEYIPLQMDNPWFSGEAGIRTYSLEETLASKLQALIFREQMRDLYDIDWVLVQRPDVDMEWALDMAMTYAAEGKRKHMSRSMAEARMWRKWRLFGHDGFESLNAFRSMLPRAAQASINPSSFNKVFARVFKGVIERLPGEPYEKTGEAIKHFGLCDAFERATAAASTGKASSQRSTPVQEHCPS